MPYTVFSQHVRRHPECCPSFVEAPVPVVPTLTCSHFSVVTSAELLQDEVARDLMNFRYEQGLSEPDINYVKTATRRWVTGLVSVIMHQLMGKDLLRPGTSMEDLKAALVVNVFEGLETKHQEMSAAKRDLPFIEPRVVFPDMNGKGEPVVSFNQAELYFRRLNHDPVFRKKIIAKSDELKKGDKYQKAPEALDDILDGSVARWHPHIHRPATPDEENDVRIPQIEQVDDLEMCNPLGVARGLHKQCGVQIACLSLPANERFTPDNIMLTVLARASVYKKHGMARVLAGVDNDGVQHDEPSHARDMKALDDGVWGTIPDDVRGGMRTIRLKVWNLTITADDPAKKSLTPFVESCKAHRHCNVCTFHAKGVNSGRPLSFLRSPAAGGVENVEIDVPKLRDEEKMRAVLHILRGVHKNAKAKAKAQKKAYILHGINKLYYALEHYPHVNLLDLPFDALHLFPDGLLRSEGAWLFYVLCKLGLDLDKVNERVRQYPDLPRDVRIPPLHPKLKKGTTLGRPRSAATLRMTGSQVMHFALHR